MWDVGPPLHLLNIELIKMVGDRCPFGRKEGGP